MSGGVVWSGAAIDTGSSLLPMVQAAGQLALGPQAEPVPYLVLGSAWPT